MMMTFFSLQSNACLTFELILTSRQVLSIETDPCQALEKVRNGAITHDMKQQSFEGSSFISLAVQQLSQKYIC